MHCCFNVSSSQNFVNMGQDRKRYLLYPIIIMRMSHGMQTLRLMELRLSIYIKVFYGANGGPADYLTYSQKKEFNSIATHQVLVNGRTVKAKYEAQTNKIKYQFQLSKKGTVDLPVLKQLIIIRLLITVM